MLQQSKNSTFLFLASKIHMCFFSNKKILPGSEIEERVYTFFQPPNLSLYMCSYWDLNQLLLCIYNWEGSMLAIFGIQNRGKIYLCFRGPCYLSEYVRHTCMKSSDYKWISEDTYNIHIIYICTLCIYYLHTWSFNVNLSPIRMINTALIYRYQNMKFIVVIRLP